MRVYQNDAELRSPRVFKGLAKTDQTVPKTCSMLLKFPSFQFYKSKTKSKWVTLTQRNVLGNQNSTVSQGRFPLEFCNKECLRNSVRRYSGWLVDVILFFILYFAVSRPAEIHYCHCPPSSN